MWVLDVVILFHPAEAGSNRLRREWVPALPSLAQLALGIQFALLRLFDEFAFGESRSPRADWSLLPVSGPHRCIA